MSNALVLYGYWRSSAAFRVRIALNLKGLPYENRPVHLLRDGGEQHAPAYRELNPQQLVPTLLHGKRAFHQSLAIIEYLDECWPEVAPLLPIGARDRAHVRAIALVVACDVHPLGNLRVVQYLEQQCGMPQLEREHWMRHWIVAGFDALEPMLADNPCTGRYCMGENPGMADACLVPQAYNALRWGLDLDAWPTIRDIHARCMELPAFRDAAPEAQPDAPQTP
jgi:maleylacetoacetate isomerase